MTAWIAWSLLTSLLVAIAAGALERVAGYAGIPRRFVVIIAMIAVVAAPLTLALQAAPARQASRVTAAIPRATPRSSESGSVTASVSSRPIAWPSIDSVDRWVARAWIAASGALLLVFIRALVGLARRQSRWDNEQTEIGPVFVARDDGPAVVGFVRPRVVLPRWALATDRATRTLLLRHEAEHIRAGDTRVLMLAEVALVAFPWNAALWWLADRLRLAIEIDCDARVVRATGDARAYGSVLLAVGERHAAAMRFAAPLTETRLNLEERIKAMTTQRPRRPIVSSLPLVAIAIGVMMTAGWAPRPTPLLRARAEQRATVSPTRRAVVPRAPDTTLAGVGYSARKQSGLGFFMDGAQINRRSADFSEVVRAVPGFRVAPAADGRSYVISDAHDQANGCVNVYVDGTLWQATTPGDIDEMLRPDQLVAIEAYNAASTPRQFLPEGQIRCATIIAWTRARVRPD
jgi:beta-lactamase regulating signal transducer with metallopeptidase domain